MTNIVSILLAGLLALVAGDDRNLSSVQTAASSNECVLVDRNIDPDPPEYYRISLVPTRSVPRIRSVDGFGDMYYQPSPFGVSIGSDGSYRYKLSVSLNGLPDFDGKSFTVWLTTPDLEKVTLVGPVDADGHIEGFVDWNKFLVVVSLEDSDMIDPSRWKGPIAYRGMSRSGLMHTMAGHGPFEQEPCQVFGYQ